MNKISRPTHPLIFMQKAHPVSVARCTGKSWPHLLRCFWAMA